MEKIDATKPLSEKSTKFKYDLEVGPSGAKVRPHLTEEDYQSLILLRDSSQWKLYRQILAATRDGHSEALKHVEETNKAFKTIGIAAGLNLAVVQLDILIEQFKAKRVQAESKKPVKPAQ